MASTQCFSYDYLNRLTTAFTITPANGTCNTTPTSALVGGVAPYWQTYTYDSTGNRTQLVNHGLAGIGDITSTSTYPALGNAGDHTLTSVAITGPGGNTSNQYTYNAVGDLTNMTVNGLSTGFTPNNQNELSTATIHATSGDQTTAYYYDGHGTEILRTTPTSKTVYLGNTEITTDASGVTITGVTRYYSQNGVTVASRNSPGTLSWLGVNDQNTAQVAIDQTSLTLIFRREDPFGNVLGTLPGWPNPHTFVGGTTEPDTLVHLGARMYDPGNGRFASDDPVTDTSDPQQLNGYTYAANNPTTSSDASGRMADTAGESRACASCAALALWQAENDPSRSTQAVAPNPKPGPAPTTTTRATTTKHSAQPSDNGPKIPTTAPAPSAAGLIASWPTLLDVAEKYGIDLSDYEIKFVRQNPGAAGETLDNEDIVLYNKAWTTELELARTLVHEIFHVDELRSGMPFPKGKYRNLRQAYEDRADAAEDEWVEKKGQFINNGTATADDFDASDNWIGTAADELAEDAASDIELVIEDIDEVGL